MNPAVAIIDYGVGNLHSLRKALEAAGGRPTVVGDPGALDAFFHIVLPGVGAFGPAAQELAPFRPALEAHLAAKRPLLGICLGMQLLFEASEESPGARGLGCMEGTVRRLASAILPAMGWNDVHGRDPLIEDGAHYYFVHSFAAPPGPATTATATHGEPYSAVVRKGSTVGLQFHPEKSGAAGLALLRRWLS
ncbi:MAG: imidazole glycerol phosphate synthase subunit HisH [Thermoplasmatota archaeon]